jgi:hypothetical protein
MEEISLQFFLFSTEIHIKMVEHVQLKFDHRSIWSESDPWLVFCAPIRVKFNRFGNISTNFGVSSTKNGGRIETSRIRPFLNEIRLIWRKTK